MGHDSIRHGRFTIIVEQSESSLYRAKTKDILSLYLISNYFVSDAMIFVTFGSALEVWNISNYLKINSLELDTNKKVKINEGTKRRYRIFY